MKRLTNRDEYGNADIIGADMSEWLANSVDYETFTKLVNALNKLAAYEDAEEQARLVEVVKCKDCCYWQDNNGSYPNVECRWGHDETPNAEDYCSYGERKAALNAEDHKY